jgi:hypothetical protein
MTSYFLFGAIRHPVTWNLSLRTQCTSTPARFNNKGSITDRHQTYGVASLRGHRAVPHCLDTHRRRFARADSCHPTHTSQTVANAAGRSSRAPSADGTRWQIHINHEGTRWQFHTGAQGWQHTVAYPHAYHIHFDTISTTHIGSI